MFGCMNDQPETGQTMWQVMAAVWEAAVLESNSSLLGEKCMFSVGTV